MKEAYILDIYYTQEPMAKTEPETAKRIYEFKVNRGRIESNNGGSGFARNVVRILLEKYNSNQAVIKWFHQSKNKKLELFQILHGLWSISITQEIGKINGQNIIWQWLSIKEKVKTNMMMHQMQQQELLKLCIY